MPMTLDEALARIAELERERNKAQDEAQENWQSVKRLTGEKAELEREVARRWSFPSWYKPG